MNRVKKTKFQKWAASRSTTKLIDGILYYNKSSATTVSNHVTRIKYTVDELNKRKKENIVTKEEKKYLLDGLIKSNIRHPIILHFYIEFFIGYSIPRKIKCKEHTTPFDFICDMFFEKVKNAIVFANRTGGKTLCMAIINHLDMTFKAGCEVASAGSTLSQANKCQVYTKDLHNKDSGFLYHQLCASDPTKTRIHYKNKSFGEIITGTIKGFNCYSSDTEVLTNEGWKLFKNLNGKEEILSLNPSTLICEWSTYNTFFEYVYKGKMVNFYSNKDDVLVTPNHNMFISNSQWHIDKNNWKLEKAEDVIKRKSFCFCRKVKWKGQTHDEIRVAGYTIPTNLFVRLMAWYLSEGYVRKNNRTITIGQSIKANKDNYLTIVKLIKELKNEIGNTNKIGLTKTYIYFNDKKLAGYLKSFGKSSDKYMPIEIKNLTTTYLKLFLNTYIKGDGWIGKTGANSIRTQFYTSSNKLASDIGELIIKIGKFPSYGLRLFSNYVIQGKKYNCKPVWTINILNQKSSMFINSSDTGLKFKKVNYKGKIYCVNLDKNHVLLTRRNGKCTWQGQSPHPSKVRIDEVDLMDSWDIIQQAMSMSLSQKGTGIMSQICFSSTRKFSVGVFQRLLDVASEHNLKFPNVGTIPFWKTYKWCIWETVEKCDRKCKADSIHGDCPAYSKCDGRAKKGSGWYPVDDFITKIVLMDTDTWNTEWLNKKPTGTVFVYGDYWDKDFHIIPRRDVEGEVWYVGGIDFGVSSGHHAVFQGYKVVVNAFKKEVEEMDVGQEFIRAKLKFFLDYEYRNSGRLTIEKLADKIKGWKYWSPGIKIFADPSAAQERIDLESIYGVETEPAINAVVSGISIVRSHLEKVKTEEGEEANFYIFDDYLDCSDVNLVATTSEFERYRYSKLKDGMPNVKDPVKAYDHGMDTVRYVINSSIPYFFELFQILEEVIEQGDGFQFDF